MKILVLHGPNLNLFGRREPHIYGTMTLAEINEKLQVLARELKVELVVFQSNHEGALVDLFHQHMDDAAGAISSQIRRPSGLAQSMRRSAITAWRAMRLPTKRGRRRLAAPGMMPSLRAGSVR